ncbi:MAG: DNA-3-methyladenine glycosylase, partial [Ruminococcus sp.]|nr:DNA-3-methyladenine glycosylase [Ruminococcus sp.]
FRAGENFSGPAKLTKALGVTGELNLQSLVENSQIWIEDDGKKHSYHTDTRVGIAYATEEFRDKQWRFILDDSD